MYQWTLECCFGRNVAPPEESASFTTCRAASESDLGLARVLTPVTRPGLSAEKSISETRLTGRGSRAGRRISEFCSENNRGESHLGENVRRVLVLVSVRRA